MNARVFLRTGALIVTSQIFVAVLGILALRLYTGIVSPAVFGTTNLVLSAVGLGLQLFVAGFVATQLRFFGEAEARGAADAFTQETMTLSLKATTILVVLILAVTLVMRVTGGLACSMTVVIFSIAWLFAMTVRNVFMSRIQAQRRQKQYAQLQVVEASLLLVLTCAALHIEASVEFFLIGQVVAVAGFVGILVSCDRQLRRLFWKSSSLEKTFGRKAWAYGAPFAPMSFLSWLANLGDRYTLALLLGSEAAGKYVAPFSIASRGMMLSNSALCDLFRPIMFGSAGQQFDRQAANAFVSWLICSFLLSTIGLLVVYFFGPVIANVLLAPGYRVGAVRIMLWVSLGYAVSGLTQIVECRLLSLGHSGRLLFPMVLGAMANLAFSILLIQSEGIVGAAKATCASFVCQNIATLGFLGFAMRRRRFGDSGATIEPT